MKIEIGEIKRKNERRESIVSSELSATSNSLPPIDWWVKKTQKSSNKFNKKLIDWEKTKSLGWIRKCWSFMSSKIKENEQMKISTILKPSYMPWIVRKFRWMKNIQFCEILLRSTFQSYWMISMPIRDSHKTGDSKVILIPKKGSQMMKMKELKKRSRLTKFILTNLQITKFTTN